ncbi:MAG: hypothetical protein AAGA54_16040 [Myxococcota bacterium]
MKVFNKSTWVAGVLVGTFLSTGCDTDTDDATTGAAGTTGSTDESETTTGSDPGSTSGTTEVDPGSTSGRSTSAGSSSGEPEDGSTSGEFGTGSSTGDGSSSGSTGDAGVTYEGPGCGITPVCDKGVLNGSIRIESEADIAEIAGYTGMVGWLEVLDSDLVCLDFLACLETVGRDVTIFGNDELKDVGGLDSLTALGTATTQQGYDDWDGSLVITQNNALEDITGFGSLTAVQQSLNINENDSLMSVSGFNALTLIEHNLVIRENPALEAIDGLDALEIVRDNFVVTGNPNLCVSNINIVGGTLSEPPASGSTAANDNGC